jgi:hypothetical protein
LRDLPQRKAIMALKINCKGIIMQHQCFEHHAAIRFSQAAIWSRMSEKSSISTLLVKPYLKLRKAPPMAFPARGTARSAAGAGTWNVPDLCATYNWPTAGSRKILSRL